MGKKKLASEFNKYKYYEKTVQYVDGDIEFIHDEYKKHRAKKPTTLREDFGGTGKMACKWVNQNSKNEAFAVDLDQEPIEFGKAHHLTKLNKEEQSRMHYVLDNVLNVEHIKTDCVAAFNFSYFIFKKREELKTYFKSVFKSLKEDGVFFLDLFGGTEAQTVQEEETEYKGYSYYWDCDKFDPITNECLFKIHFKPKGQKKIKDVFVYDWRLWSLPELRDILQEVGFSQVHAYWEEDDDEGEGNGNFYITESEENCESWVTYLVALK